MPPIVTTAVLLDAKAYLGKGQGNAAGRSCKAAKDIEGDAQSAGARQSAACSPGDVLYIYTGWGDNWKDPDTEKVLLHQGSRARLRRGEIHRSSKKVVLVALDNPFTDPVADGFLQGKAAPPEGTPEGSTVRDPPLQSGSLRHPPDPERATSARCRRTRSGCRAMICRCAQGASGSPVRPVSISAPSSMIDNVSAPCGRPRASPDLKGRAGSGPRQQKASTGQSISGGGRVSLVEARCLTCDE